MQPPPQPTPQNPPGLAQQSRIRRLLQRAETYAGSGQRQQAISTLQEVLERQPDLASAIISLAELELASDRYNEARASAFRALDCQMDSPRTALKLIHLLSKLSESGVIIQMVQQAPPQVWDSPQSLTEIAHELSLFGAYEHGRGFAEAAIQRDPEHPPSRFMMATIELFHGNLEAAAEHARHCLRYLPADASSHWLLSRLRLPDPAPRIARLREILAGDLSPQNRAEIAYALHNELHDSGDYGAAWEALETACRAMRSTLAYHPDDANKAFDALRSWRRDEIRDDGCADERLTPVFVIGLHRSGTTLAERMLGGHSRIAAGGETYDIRAALRRATGLNLVDELDLRAIESRSNLDYQQIGQSYLQGVAWRAKGLPIVTDKLPTNYMNVGFIARALPNARFIHLNRDPMDVGLSSLRTLFSHACPYSYDQVEYASYYKGYRDLMDHWRDLLPERILDIDYNDLVGAPEESAALMARFCGVEPEAGMVDIGSNQSAVSTASSVMMREGIRKDRGGLWKRYGEHLGPMKSALGVDG